MTSSTGAILVDETHCGRHVTGLERITLELFSAAALAPLPVTPVRASGRKAMMLRQTLDLRRPPCPRCRRPFRLRGPGSSVAPSRWNRCATFYQPIEWSR